MRSGGSRPSRFFAVALFGALGGAFACAGKSLRRSDDGGDGGSSSAARGGGSGNGSSTASGGTNASGGMGALGGTGGSSELCVVGEWQYEVAPVAVMILVEETASMQKPLADTGRSRWDAVRSLLVDPVQGLLANVPRSEHFGLTLFSASAEGTSESCPHEEGVVMPAPDNFAVISRAFPLIPPERGTAAAVGAGVEVALARLLALDPSRYDRKAIVLVADGIDGTCTVPLDWSGGESAAQLAIERAYELGVMTVVIDAGGGEQIGPLERLADRGQGWTVADPIARTYSPLRPDELRALFDRSSVDVSCSLPLAMRVSDDAVPLGRVTLDDMGLAYGDDWVLVDGATLELTPRACEMLARDDNHRLVAEFPCDALGPL